MPFVLSPTTPVFGDHVLKIGGTDSAQMGWNKGTHLEPNPGRRYEDREKSGARCLSIQRLPTLYKNNRDSTDFPSHTILTLDRYEDEFYPCIIL